jgi:DNA-binding response OmpR family regulator
MRLHALLRRPNQYLGNSLGIANIIFDTESRQIFIDEAPQLFSARETAVLELLVRRQSQVVSKKLLEDHIFGWVGHGTSNAVEVYVSRLRKKLIEHGGKVKIEAIRGVGYMIVQNT